MYVSGVQCRVKNCTPHFKGNEMTDKNRVEEEFTKVLKELAEKYFESEVIHAHELFSDAAWPSLDDPHYIKKTTFTVNARKAHLALLKSLAQHASGAVHPQGANHMAEKKQADELLAKAKSRIEEQLKHQAQQAEIIELKKED